MDIEKIYASCSLNNTQFSIIIKMNNLISLRNLYFIDF